MELAGDVHPTQGMTQEAVLVEAATKEIELVGEAQARTADMFRHSCRPRHRHVHGR